MTRSTPTREADFIEVRALVTEASHPFNRCRMERDMTSTAPRPDVSTQKALDHHLGAFAQGLDEVLRDYDENSVLVTPDKTYTGLAQIRGFFKAFIAGADPEFWGAFNILNMTVTGEVAYIAWQAKPWVTLATDTFHVKDEKISVQTFTSFSA
jgi:hypothetical protein